MQGLLNTCGRPRARVSLRRLGLCSVAVFLASGAGMALADSLLLQQTLPGNVAGKPFLLIDRARISHVVVSKDTSLRHQLSIRLATDPPASVELTCNDEAVTRQLLDALRQGALPTLDITGRCQL